MQSFSRKIIMFLTSLNRADSGNYSDITFTTVALVEGVEMVVQVERILVNAVLDAKSVIIPPLHTKSVIIPSLHAKSVIIQPPAIILECLSAF
jgi:hypothetical protein